MDNMKGVFIMQLFKKKNQQKTELEERINQLLEKAKKEGLTDLEKEEFVTLVKVNTDLLTAKTQMTLAKSKYQSDLVVNTLGLLTKIALGIGSLYITTKLFLIGLEFEKTGVVASQTMKQVFNNTFKNNIK